MPRACRVAEDVRSVDHTSSGFSSKGGRMAIISIGNRPDLTKEQIQQIFAERFSEYEVIKSTALNRDFILKKNAWTGVGVRLKQEKDGKTAFVFTALMPNVFLQTFFGGLFAYALLRKSWKEMEL